MRHRDWMRGGKSWAWRMEHQTKGYVYGRDYRFFFKMSVSRADSDACIVWAQSDSPWQKKPWQYHTDLPRNEAEVLFAV